MTVLAANGALTDWIEGFGASPWLLALALALATFASEDLACISGGILAAKGTVDLPVAITACAMGIWMGDVMLYGVGAVAGNTRKHWKWMDRLVSPKQIARGQRLFERYGVRWVFASRFLPGMRLPSYLAAGAVGWSFRKFGMALALAAWIWTPVRVGLSFLAGRSVLEWLEAYQKWAWPVLLGVVFLLWLGLRVVGPLWSWRGRRLLLSKWIRIRRWEFWPLGVVYTPVVLYLLWQALRLRGATLFTCCNPAIPNSGFALESKGDILDALHSPDESRIRVARYRRLATDGEPGSRVAEVERFLADEGLAYPVVLKPDVLSLIHI